MTVHAAQTGDHCGGMDEQRHGTRVFVVYRREGGDRLERNHLRRCRWNRADGHQADGRRASRKVHHFSSLVSIGSVRMRVPVAAKIALVTAGATAAVGASPKPPGDSALFTRCVSMTGTSFIRIGR